VAEVNPHRPSDTSPKSKNDLGEEIIELLNYVDGQCLRHLHLMSNIEFDAACMSRYAAVNGVVTREAGVWHLRAMHPYRGTIDIPAACKEGKIRRLVVWSLAEYASVQVALHDVWREYGRLFGGSPQFAFMRKLPRSVENGHEIGGMILLEAEWMLERCVAVGCKSG